MHVFRLIPVAALVSAAASTALIAQTAPAQSRAAETITAADVARRITIIAHDSMGGRDTPSPGLEKTAQYVADEFARFGLKPAGENATWFQRYQIVRRQLSPTTSHVGFMMEGGHHEIDLAQDARFFFGGAPEGNVHAAAILVGGAFTASDAAALSVKDKAVLLVADLSGPMNRELFNTARALLQGGAAGIIVVSNRDSTAFAKAVANQAVQVRTEVQGLARGGAAPVVEVHERALGEILKAAGVDMAALRTSTTPVSRELTGVMLGFHLEFRVLESASAPNTIGMIEGSDPNLKGEYVVYSAHMDHVGAASHGQCQARGGDSICNGADDDASGTVGVVELAEAFSRKGARPKRSMIFMTVSGEEKGLYGSSYFVEHPTVPLDRIVADINLDMIGRNWPDTIVAIGREHSDLGTTLARVQDAHPELRMTAIDDKWPQESFYTRSDHFNFAKKGVPILFFFNGVHDDYHQVSDSPDKIDAEKESRIVRLLFYLGQDIANSPERPKWNPESYGKYVEKPTT